MPDAKPQTTDSPFRVAYNPDGSFGWWESWSMPEHRKAESRSATPEETDLMNKIIWRRDTAQDRERLKEIINAGRI